jgi:DNA polymerase-3 subunit epsilon
MHPEFRWIGQSQDGQTVTLRRFSGGRPEAWPVPKHVTPDWLALNSDRIRTGVVIDVETTGLNRKADTVIEIGLRRFRFDRATGELVDPGVTYTGLQDPGAPLSDDIKRLTGLTDADVAGRSIDWSVVASHLEAAQVIIAHNAAFDRSFIDRQAPVSAGKVWACSLKQIDWWSKGFTSSKLEILAIYHGFFADSHRAQSDVDATLNLLTLEDWTTRRPYLSELLANARRPIARVWATSSPFETKDALKERGYAWDANARVWTKVVFQEDAAAERSWMEAAVYKGDFRGRIEDIAATDNFKS